MKIKHVMYMWCVIGLVMCTYGSINNHDTVGQWLHRSIFTIGLNVTIIQLCVWTGISKVLGWEE